MANIIINNYCNQTCSYCFAWKNMGDQSLKREMSLKTFLYCLKHLKAIGDDRVRILGGEPLLYKNIKKIFQLSTKGGFYMTIFSNFRIPLSKWEDILDLGEDYDYYRLKFNLNLNDEDFYKKAELDLIYDSLEFLKNKGCDVVISYNVHEYSHNYGFIFDVAKKYQVSNVILKVTNTVMGDTEIIDTNSKEYGKYLYNIVHEYYRNYNIHFSCGLSSLSFSEEQKKFLEKVVGIPLKWGCENNGGKYDINTDGTVYRCFPLQNLYAGENYHITSAIYQKGTIEKVRNYMESVVPRGLGLTENHNCLGNQINKINVNSDQGTRKNAS